MRMVRRSRSFIKFSHWAKRALRMHWWNQALISEKSCWRWS